MNHITDIIVLVLVGLVFSRLLQIKMNIPLPLTLLSLSMIISSLYHFEFSFDAQLMALLPLLLLGDALQVSLKDIIKNRGIILYTAVFSVIMSVLISSLLMTILIKDYDFVFYFALFSIIMATDAISVSNVFSGFKQIDHHKKFIVESESLFNDPTAMILFTVIALPLISGGDDLSLSGVAEHGFTAIASSIVIGIITGYLTSRLLNLFNSAIDEFFILPLPAYIAFMLTESVHGASILAIIVSVITFKYLVDLSIQEKAERIDYIDKKIHQKIAGKLFYKIETTREKLKHNKQIVEYFSLIAVAFLFFSIGFSISLESVMKYWAEILIVFLLTTVVRYWMLKPLSVIDRALTTKDNFLFTFSGVKGGLSILMVHMVPSSYVHKEALENIVFGQIILSTFVYVILLMVFIPKLYKETQKNGT